MSLRNDPASWYKFSSSIDSVAPNKLCEKVLKNCVVRLLCNDLGRYRISDCADTWSSLGQGYARRANRRSIAAIRPDSSGSFHCDLDWNGVCDFVSGWSLAAMALLGGMGGCGGKCNEYGAKLDHAVNSGTQALGPDHDCNVRFGCGGGVFLALKNQSIFRNLRSACAGSGHSYNISVVPLIGLFRRSPMQRNPLQHDVLFSTPDAALQHVFPKPDIQRRETD